MSRSRILRSLLAGGVCALSLAGAAAGQTHTFNVPSGDLKAALDAYVRQSGVQLIYRIDDVRGKRSSGVHGALSSNQALTDLLSGTGLTVSRDTSGAIAIVRGTAGPQSVGPSSGADGVLAPVDEVVVTGTHIRGTGAIASPTVEFNQEDLRREGDATVAQALAKFPQVFNGQGTANSYLVGSDKQGTNTSAATGVDLRGLGPSATLVLLNGRRLAGTGTLGDFVDVSAIPTAAVDHVEIVLDGASAIYGSDAVGGVVNIITKKRFEGAETSFRIAEDAGGVGASGQVGQTFGLGWDRGNLLVALEYQHDDPLSAGSRRYTANTDLTSLGGTNHDVLYSSPGNILGINASGTAYVSAFAIPAGNGLGLTPSSFLPGQTNLENANTFNDILPEQDRTGVFLDLQQAIDTRTTLDLEARYNLRVFQYNGRPGETTFAVTPKDPFYVTPNGSASELIGYAEDVTGPQSESGTSVSWDVSAGLDRDLGHTWRFSAYAGFAEEDGRNFVSNIWNSTHLNEALGNIAPTPGSSYNPATMGYFDPYGDGSANSRALLSYIADGYARFTSMSQVSTIDMQVDGTLLNLPGGPIKAAFGIQYRHERFEAFEEEVASTSPYVAGGVPSDRDVTAAFGELEIPLVGPGNAVPGIERLDLSVAGRVEHYDDVGTTTNPKVGLVWRPMSQLKVHATYGTSFRAPALPELHTPTQYTPDPIASGGQSVLTLIEFGGNPGLKPETASTWTAGVDWSPPWLKTLQLGVDWFDVDFKNQISTPGINIVEAGLDAPAYAGLVTHLDPSNAADLALVKSLLAKTAYGSLYPATAFTAIIDDRYVNAAALNVAGVDFHAAYGFKIGRNTFAVLGSATKLYDYSERVTALAPSQQFLSTPDYPVDFRGRLTGTWSRGPFSLAGSINYVGSYRDPVANRPISSWTTFDLSATWTSGVASGPLRGVTVTAAAQNLFDEDPPFYDSPNAVGYDPANANPLGRVVSLQLSKRW